MYAQYLQKYDAYIEKLEHIRELKTATEQAIASHRQHKKELSMNSKKQLKALQQQQQLYEVQIASLKAEGEKSAVVQQFHTALVAQIHTLEQALQVFTKQQELELQALQQQLNEQIAPLTAADILDEAQRQMQLRQEGEQHMQQLRSTYTQQIAAVQLELQQVHATYDRLLDEQHMLIRKNEKTAVPYAQLVAQQETNTLPANVVKSLEEPIESFIERQALQDGERVIHLTKQVKVPGTLQKFMPAWVMPTIHIGIPLFLAAIVFACFYFSNIEFAFVETASNAIATFLTRALATIAAGALVFGALLAFVGPIIAGIGAVVGGIIGFSLTTDVDIILPAGFTSTVEWIVKILICLAVLIVVFFINTCTSMESKLAHLAMKLRFVQAHAAAKQGEKVANQLDSYYALLRHYELLVAVTNNARQQQATTLTATLKQLQQQLAEAVTVGEKQLQQQQVQKMQQEKDAIAAYEQQATNLQQQLEKQQAATANELAALHLQLHEGSQQLVQTLTHDLQACLQQQQMAQEQDTQQLALLTDTYEQQQQRTQTELAMLQASLKPDYETLYKCLTAIYQHGSPSLEEIEGILSDSLYIFNPAELTQMQQALETDTIEDTALPVKLHQIVHAKQPIVFLYDGIDSSKIATQLFPFMEAINVGLYVLNYRHLYDLYIVDPVSKGIHFKHYAQKGLLHLVDNMKTLDETISQRMDQIASQYGQLAIDDVNRQLIAQGCDDEDLQKFGKYSVVQFIVPKHDSAQNTNFFTNDLWTRFETSQKHGFVPIFYIHKLDWENALREDSRHHHPFIQKLRQALGQQHETIYTMDAQALSIDYYEEAF